MPSIASVGYPDMEGTALSDGGRRFCENCGTHIGPLTNFCPNCGAAQHPDPEVPTGPPPPIPEPGRISTPNAPNVPPPPQQAARSGRRGLSTAQGVVVIIVLLLILSRLGGGGPESSSEGSTTATEPSTQDQAQKQPGATQKQAKSTEDSSPHFSDGAQQVGSDIQPGTYRTREGSRGCYYERLSGFSGEFDEILANDNTDGPAIVTIDSTDAGFKSQGCGTWTQDMSAVTDSTASFKDGTYLVGTDIEPGTYRSSGSSGCYYQRMSGFHHTFDELIANDNTDNPAVVQIAPTDAGFESQRCGTWTKIE